MSEEERKPFFIHFEFCIMEDGGGMTHPSFRVHADDISESVEENVLNAAEETIRASFSAARTQSQTNKKLERKKW